jgi:glycosyltransferase involved in cell wall biosynthesis
MRVAIDTNGLFTGQAGGARYIRGLLGGMRNLAPPLDYFQFAWEVENLAYQQPTRSLKTLYRELLWAHTVAPWQLAHRGADLYHATGSYFVSVPKSVRCVATLYDLAMLRHPERFRAWQRWSETRRLQRLKSVDRVICISRFTADEAMALLGLPSSQLEVVYCGVDFLRQHGPVIEQEPDFQVPGEFFLFVGSLEPGKNLVLLKETYRAAAERGKPLPPLLIVGARWAGVGTEGQPPPGWHYLGRQPDGVLVHLYRRTLALVFPSKYEGFGLPVAEAMALGCPVICSPVASLPEVGGKAVLWSELSPASYGQAMSEMAANAALRTELVRAGQNQAARFTWESCAKAVVEIYHAVCRHRP